MNKSNQVHHQHHDGDGNASRRRGAGDRREREGALIKAGGALISCLARAC